MQPLKAEKSRSRKKEALAEISEGGLRLQTPQNAYQAPHRGYVPFKEDFCVHPAVYGNSMVVLNSEAPAYHVSTMKSERRLATRHGFPNPGPSIHLQDASGRLPPSRQGQDKWNITKRHSISSQVDTKLHHMIILF